MTKPATVCKPFPETADKQLLVLGIGNASRGDDGLGWALLDRLAEQGRPGWHIEYRFQLAVEDAELLTNYPAVLFIDASETPLPDGYRLSRLEPDPEPGLYTHEQTPGAMLFLTNQLFDHQPEAWLLEVCGYDWELGAGLSEKAKENLEQAWKCFEGCEASVVAE